MKCREQTAILLSRCALTEEMCSHQFCRSCFRKENSELDSNIPHTFNCPCCHTVFYANMKYIDEAILIGEAATIRNTVYPQLVRVGRAEKTVNEIIPIDDMNKLVIEKLESALQLNPSNFDILYLLFRCCTEGIYLIDGTMSSSYVEFYSLKLLDSSYKLLSHPQLSDYTYESVKCKCYFESARIFHTYHNYPAAYKYSKLAYEECLRSPDHTKLSMYKTLYLQFRPDFTNLPPLRFAVGDEVEFLHESETGSEWKRGKVVELYYREQTFDISFTAPYRLQLLGNFDAAVELPVYAYVKADLARYVRKVGVRLLEDTRYQARLDAKVDELAGVYHSTQFMKDIYRTLALDREFVDMLQSVWQVELSEPMLCLYSALIMHRQPLVRATSGYHVPSSEEVITGIKAYFDPAHLHSDAAPSGLVCEDKYLKEIRAYFLGQLRGSPVSFTNIKDDDIQGFLLESIRNYLIVLSQACPSASTAELCDCCDPCGTIPSTVSDAVSNAASDYDFKRICTNRTGLEEFTSSRSGRYVIAWYALHKALVNNNAGPAFECPFVYLFVKYCIDRGLGVPKLALAVYDRMNMQLSREFIRCANPSCELNRLDQSTGQVKFKKCSRCQAVIYCSRECQVAHYPEHKRLCREHAAGQEGS